MTWTLEMPNECMMYRQAPVGAIKPQFNSTIGASKHLQLYISVSASTLDKNYVPGGSPKLFKACV